MTHVLSRRVVLGCMMGGATFALAGCPNLEFVLKDYYYLKRAIKNAIARLVQQAAAPGTSADLRERMNEMITVLEEILPELDVELGQLTPDSSNFSGDVESQLGRAADLMIESGNLRIRRLYARPSADGGGSWINAWWDYSSP